MGLVGLRAAALLMAVVAAVVVLEVPNAAAEVIKVGGDKGWTTIESFDYKQWAANRNFSIGDTIVFQYDTKFHNVMRVSHAQYRACNASSPIETFLTGNDSFQVKTPGHHYFLCGTPGHCQAGQKVDINVLGTNSSEAQAPSLSPAGKPLGSNAPSPAPSGATQLYALKGLLSLLGFGIAIFTAFA